MEKEINQATFDDWHAETQLRLEKSLIYKELKKKCSSVDSPAGYQVLALIDEATTYAFQRTKTVLLYMKEFTLHDGDHLFRVLNLMERLIPRETIIQLSIPELMLLILTAFFHDIGMSPSAEEIKGYLEHWSTDYKGKKTSRFSRFVSSHPEKLLEIERLKQEKDFNRIKTLQEYLISEFIRRTHGERARDIIARDWNGKIVYRDIDLTTEFAALCFSHVQDTINLLDMDSSLLCGPETYACLPFIGVILRLADILDFDPKRTPEVLFANLGVKHPVSLIEWKKHQQITSWTINSHQIAFSAKCEHPAIEASIHSFCNMIDNELIGCNNVLQHISDQIRSPFPAYYKLTLPPRVLRDKIETKKDIWNKPLYDFRNCQFSLNETQIIDLLMGTNLYGDRQVTVRELLQNSIDTCLVRSALERSWGNPYEPEIVVEFISKDKESILRISDNGMGMDQDIIERFFSKVGASYYKSPGFYEIQAKYNLNFIPISRFGIGILACFLSSDYITVDTRHIKGPHDADEPILVRIEGIKSIFWFLQGTRTLPGTTIELKLRAHNIWQDMSIGDKVKFIKKIVPNPPFPIKIISDTQTTIHNHKAFQEPKADSTFQEDSEDMDPAKSTKDKKSWADSSILRRFDINLTDHALGLDGKAAVAVLELEGSPIKRSLIFSRKVKIEGLSKSKTLKAEYLMSSNAIIRIADYLELSENEIKVPYHYWVEYESYSNLSIHGISIPTSLFPSNVRKINFQLKNNLFNREKSYLVFPFPIYIRIDITGTRDLDLNAARTEIIYNSKWINFANTLSYKICFEIRKQVNSDYWKKLSKIWKGNSYDMGYFIKGLTKAEKE